MDKDLKVTLQHKGLPYFGYRYQMPGHQKDPLPSRIIISFRADNRSSHQKGHVWGIRYQKAGHLLGTKDWQYCYSGSERNVGNADSIVLALFTVVSELIGKGWRITSIPTADQDDFLKRLHAAGKAEQKQANQVTKAYEEERRQEKLDGIARLREIISEHGHEHVEEIYKLWNEYAWEVREENNDY